MTTPAEPVRRIALSGEIDVATAPDAFAEVVAASPSAGDLVTFDLSGVTFMDSTGIAMLLMTKQYLEAMGCRFTIAVPSDRVMYVLEMLGLTEQFALDDG